MLNLNNIIIYGLLCGLGALVMKVILRNYTQEFRYTVVSERITGLLYMGVFFIYGMSTEFILGCIFTTLLVLITVIDLDTFTIPDKLNGAILIVALLHICLTDDLTLLSRIIGFFIISFPMFALTMCVSGAFGGGDIKMMAAAGLLLGVKSTVVAGFTGVVLGGMYGVYLLRFKEKGSQTHMAFGPYLAIGCYIALLYGTSMADWYIGNL